VTHPTNFNPKQLTDQIIQDNGSFIQKFEYFPVDKECSDQNSASVETPFSGGGGYWITIAGDYIFGNETLIRWSTYICSKGFVAGESCTLLFQSLEPF
jgi:hypothetical protein